MLYHSEYVNRLCLLLIVGLCIGFESAVCEEYGRDGYMHNDGLFTEGQETEANGPPKRIRKIPSWIPIPYESEIYVDLIFLLDGSGSVSEENFSTVKHWISDVSRGFGISSGIFQIGVVQYSHWYRFRAANNQRYMKTEIALGECQDHDCLDEKLRNITLMGYSTFTGFAINKTVNEDFESSRNLNVSTKILVLLTDGPSQDFALYAANYARSKNITIFCVGVAQYNIYELQLIANGEFGNNLRIYPMKEFVQLTSIVGSLQSEIKAIYLHPVCPPLTSFHGSVTCDNLNNVGSKCEFSCDPAEKLTLIGSGSRRCKITPHGITWGGEPSTCGICDAKFDLLLILDSSSSVSNGDFELMKEFLQDVIGAFPIDVDHVQVSCMRYHNSTIDEFEYDDFKTKESVIAAVHSIDRKGKGTLTGKALRHAVERKFATDTGRRNSVPHITLLITDGPAKDDVTEYGAKLKQMSRVLVIGLNNAKQNQIDAISSENGNSVLSSYKELAGIVWKTVNSSCAAVDIVKNTSCGPLSEPENSSSKCSGGVSDSKNSDDKTVGTKCTLQCRPGYKTPGTAGALCDYNGNWMEEHWRCIEKDCPPVDAQGGVVVRCTANRINSECRSRCKPGYLDLATDDNNEWHEKMENYIEYIHLCTRIEGGDPKWNPSVITCLKNDTCSDTICNHGKCLEDNNDFVCECDLGYTGMFCEEDVDECKFRPCDNGGICVNEENGYECFCASGYGGDNCQNDVDECQKMPCKNEAICSNTFGSFRCDCLDGYNGTLCEENIDDCSLDPCKNGANCQDGVNMFKCICIDGYTGKMCEELLNPCATYPCGQNELCTPENISFSCTCVDGFRGENCSIVIKGCESGPCLNGGLCHDVDTSYHCECDYGYTGKDCEIFFDHCDCGMHGTCRNAGDEIECDCEDGYTGTLCETDIDHCGNHSCKNGALCRDMVHNYTCECAEGYSGAHCETVCSPNPCKNSGTCIERQESYFACLCVPGYIGQLCEIYDNECDLDPCKNEGICNPEPHTYSCTCPEEYTGINCTEDVDECAMDPPKCKNGATCSNTVGSFNCTCQKRYWGELCDEELCFLPKNATTIGEMTCTNGDVPGSKCKLHCPKTWRVAFRHRKMGPELTLTCHKNGTWSNATEQFQVVRPRWECEEMECPSPEPHEKGPVKFVQVGIHPTDLIMEEETHIITCTNGTMVGSVCALTCHSSFSLMGHKRRKCNEYGVWEGLDGPAKPLDGWKCKQEKCIIPVPKENSHELACTNLYQPNSRCFLRCMPNFIRIGPTDKTCDKRTLTWVRNGWWACKEVRCEESLPDIANGRFVCSDGERLGSICRFRCDPGFLLDVEDIVICKRDRNTAFWSGDKPRTCRRSECDFEINLKTGTYTRQDLIPNFVVLRRIPFRSEQESKSAEIVEPQCDMKAIIAINITQNEAVSVQLWYGESSRGYHTMFSNKPDTNAFGSSASSDMYGLTGYGTGDGTAAMLLISGFNSSDLAPTVEFPSTVNVTLGYNEWSWKSRGQWDGTLFDGSKRTSALRRRTSRKPWYEVFFGMNSVLSDESYYLRASYAGLCYVCLKKT